MARRADSDPDLPPGVRSYTLKGDKATYYYGIVDAGRHRETGRRQQKKIRFHHETGERFRTQKACRTAMEAERVKRRVGDHVEPAKITLGQYLDGWLDKTAQDRRPSTNVSYRDALKRLEPHLYDTPLARLSAPEIQRAYRRLLEDGYAHSSVCYTHTVLRAALRQAVADRLLAFDPSAIAAVPRPEDEPDDEEPPHVIWTADETARFLAETRQDPEYPLWMLLFHASLRIGEALALYWDDVDLEAGIVRVRRTLTVDDRRRVVVGKTTKTRSSRRTLTISGDTVAALREHRDKQADRRVALNGVWDERGFVFDRGDGHHYSPQAIRRRLSAACDAAKVPRITPHGMRHGGTTLAVASGVPLRLMADRLGHHTTALVDRIYTHPTTAGDKLVSDVLSRLLQPDSDAV